MTHQELELWTLEIIGAELKNQRIEDSKIELKSSWPEPSKAMNRANHLVTVTLAVPSQHRQPLQIDEAWKAVRGCGELIKTARESLSRL